MKIIKVPISEQNREIFFSKEKTKSGKQKWEQLLSKSQSMTATEFWENEWNTYNAENPTHWFFIVGAPESIIDELINLKLGESNVYYPWICEHSPEDLIESRIDWGQLKEHADDMYYFIERLYDYI